MHEAYTRTGKIAYTGGHTNDKLVGIELKIKGVPMRLSIEKDGSETTIETFEQSGTVNFSIGFEYESDALTALDTIISSAFEAKRAIEQRHQAQANSLRDWAQDIKSSDKRCVVCRSTDHLEAHHIEAKSYSPSFMLSFGNGVTLCKPCHEDFHSYCGDKRVSRRDFHNWLKSKGKNIFPLETRKTTKTAPTVDSPTVIAKTILEQTGSYPSIRKLMQEANVTYHRARKTLEELKQTRIS